jgi:hypothetical protein
MFGILSCLRIDATIEGANQLPPRCDEHNWSGGEYIVNTIVLVARFWVGNASLSSPVGGRLANDALPDISAPLTWPAGAFASRYRAGASIPGDQRQAPALRELPRSRFSPRAGPGAEGSPVRALG